MVQSKDKKDYGVNHKVNSPKSVTIFLDDDGAVFFHCKKIIVKWSATILTNLK